MKSLTVLMLAALLAACAAETTSSTSSDAKSGNGRDCVRRTGSNLCS